MPESSASNALPSSASALSDSDAFGAYEKDAAREIEEWSEGEAGTLSKALRLVAKPFDWAAERSETEGVMEKVNEQIVAFLGTLSDASTWTYEEERVLERGREDYGITDVASITGLRSEPMEPLDALARSYFGENAVLSALEGGTTGLGGVALLAADVPALFTLNLRLIQQIGASYGFPLDGPEARPLVLRVFSAAVADTPEARQDALEELRAAGRAVAQDGGDPTSGTKAGVSAQNDADGTETAENQSRVMVNEIARNVAAREMAQLVPLAGAATGAGLNYWFTTATAEAAYMLSRALFLEHRQQQEQGQQRAA